MPLSRQFRAFWARYVAPSRFERDPGFRSVLHDASHRGLLVAGTFGIVALVGFGIATITSGILAGKDMMAATMSVGEVLSDKLLVLAASAGFLIVARMRPSVRVSRALMMVYVIVAGIILVADDVVRVDLEFTAAWLSLLLLLTVGTVPFQPVQTALLGAVLIAFHTFADMIPELTTNQLGEGASVRRFAFLLLFTFVCSVMNGALYTGRQRQYRTAQRLGRLRDRLRRRGIDLEARGTELEAQRAELAASLDRLGMAQTQLIQQEKMASLGQLTAGVAHELKNPLNFVNNFAQLSVELLQELEEELREDKTRSVEDALNESSDLLEDLQTNAEKIREHGRRADGIIRSMLAHSRATPGPRRTAKLNPLLDEYIGLAYHGMRANHTGFNVDITKDFDPELPEIEMVPEEMGRVFLNLLDNALAAVRARAQTASSSPPSVPYQPALTVRTRTLPSREMIAVSIEDNGTGIPEAAREKIFEPFFTTKPTGEGTGLGLSLTYEIVVHGHGGGLDVESTEGEGTTFIVRLPVTAPEAPEIVPIEEAPVASS
ncbi:MAG: ATP-binding protein [Bacteroidota bacterium]